jgi:hypothetical protein
MWFCGLWCTDVAHIFVEAVFGSLVNQKPLSFSLTIPLLETVIYKLLHISISFIFLYLYCSLHMCSPLTKTLDKSVDMILHRCSRLIEHLH